MGRKPKRSAEQCDGIIIINKPKGPTSTACLNDIKYQLRQFKIGHAGTLDPMAEGILVVLLGQGTKLAPYLSSGEKSYYGELQLGITTDTYDIEGKILTESPVKITQQELQNAISEWKNLTKQVVPAYSAAKYNGKPLYSLARAGEPIPCKEKDITVFKSEPLDIATNVASFRVRCSAGTYIRSLVHSLGMRLGCGAVLTRLIREESTPFLLKDATKLQDVLNDPKGFPQRVIPMEHALPHWPRIRLNQVLADWLMNGVWLPATSSGAMDLSGNCGDRALFESPQGTPLALVEIKMRDGQLAWSILRGLWETPVSRF